MGSNEHEAANTRARVHAAHLLEIVDTDRPGGSRVPVQRTVLGRGSMDAAAARIPPLENRGDQLNAVPEVGARRRQQVVLPVLEGRAVAGKALEQVLGAGSEQPTRRDGKRDEGPRTRSQRATRRPFALVVPKLALVLQM